MAAIERTHQGGYKPRDPSASSGKCPTTSIDAEYAVDSIRLAEWLQQQDHRGEQEMTAEKWTYLSCSQPEPLYITQYMCPMDLI